MFSMQNAHDFRCVYLTSKVTCCVGCRMCCNMGLSEIQIKFRNSTSQTDIGMGKKNAKSLNEKCQQNQP